MLMSSCGEAGDGPAVLQLQKWGHLQFQLELSEFCQASISPTRDLLLLLSYQCEASLIPLIFGRFNFEDFQEPSTLEHAASCRSDSFDDASYGSKAAEIVSDTVFSRGSNSSAFESCPVISDVKSFAWGCFGDSYSQLEDSGLRELLIVSGDNGIFVHAFCNPNRNKPIESMPECGAVHGKWVDWGPSCGAEEQSSRSDNCKNLNDINEVCGTSGSENVHAEIWDLGSSSGSSAPKNWLRTFLINLDTIVSGGKYVARFPTKSSLPNSAEVVSFNIYDSTLKFLEFHSRNSPLSNNEDQSADTVIGDCMLTSDLPFSSNYSDVASTDVSYMCSKVFTSSSQRLVGLVLNFPGNEDKVLVVVIMLYQWGMQWVSSVNLQDQYTGPDPSLKWVDFQFSEDFLVCLNASGLICIWGAMTANFVTSFDVIRGCGLDLKVHYELNQPELPVNPDLPSKPNVDRKVDKKIETHGRETCHRDFVCSRTFRRLMVASRSFLLAIIDEQGVIYVMCAADYIPGKHNTNKFIHSSQQSDCGVLADWKVAGCEIGGRKVLSDRSPARGLYVSNLSAEDSLNENYSSFTKFRKRKQHTEGKESQLDVFSSGFTTCSHVNGWENFYFDPEVSSAPLRRIFLPLDRDNKEDTICFSPFGITRLAKSCSMKEQNIYKIVHTSLHVVSSVLDDGDLDKCELSKRCSLTQRSSFVGESIGCSFQGCLYLVTRDGLSVVLPSVSISSGVLPAESIRYWQNSAAGSKSQTKTSLAVDEFKELGSPWQIEVLDRTLLYEGPKEAERISLENGWDLKIARMRRMLLALQYLKSDEIEQSLDMLVDVNMAEEGILQLLFTSVYPIFCKVGSDTEVALASRLLALSARFATKMVHRYGLLEHKKEKFVYNVKKDSDLSYRHPLQIHDFDEVSNSRRLHEMAQFLEVIRNLQSRLSSKRRRLGQEPEEGIDAKNMMDADVFQEDSSLPLVSVEPVPQELLDALEDRTKRELDFAASELAFDNTHNLALSPVESSSDVVNSSGIYVHEAGAFQKKKLITLENSKSMIARWDVDNINLKAVVEDALRLGRLPLAVLQLHLQRQKESLSEKEPSDTFSEVCEVGRSIAYDLFLKGESGLAVETLLRLGEDIEIILKQLLFGTVRKSLRAQVAEEMKKYGYLSAREWRTLENISLIERLYPSSSFWGTFIRRQKEISETASRFTLLEAKKSKLIFHMRDNHTIECGDIDGVVTGSWASVANGGAAVCEDNTNALYWACAAIWSDAWDQRTLDRIVLDQPFHMGIHVAWESELEYHMAHNDLEEIYKLLDVISTSSLLEGSLEINLGGSHTAANIGTNDKFPDYAMYLLAGEELELMSTDIPDVKIFRFPAVDTCSSWLQMIVEKELAKKFIFFKEYWESAADIVPLLARAGLVIDTAKIFSRVESSKNSGDLEVQESRKQPKKDTEEALHKLVIHYCTQYNLPNLLDLYLDHHKLVLDDGSLSSLLEAAGDCQWAKWLLFSRIKGREYEASLSNARSTLSGQLNHGSNLSVLETDEIIHTVDDMAEGGGEMAALATLMYAAAPIQKCLCTGSVNRHCSFSSQCTLENLRPGLQQFPTLWRTLLTACQGQDDNGCCLNSNAANVFGKSIFSDYLNWRDTIFYSTGGDTSLVQMLPSWFQKSIRRLIQLFVQGPLGWQSLSSAVSTGESSLYRENTHLLHASGNAGISPINWEVAIQRSVEKELYSSLEEKGYGVEHHLHRGRALAAFNHILGVRALRLKSSNAYNDQSGQMNIQSDVQAMLAPLTQNEGPILSCVVPLAIMHFEDSVLVASCTFLLEICGLSASMLRVDVAVLQRISSFYSSMRHIAHYEHVSPRGSAFHAASHEGDITVSLVQALADSYIQHDHLNILEQRDVSCKVSKDKQHLCPLMTVLQHLEKASLPSMDEGKTCGYWLSTGNGDGSELRAQQKDASLQWNLVTTFCQMHHLPLSTKYVALLANDNDWVGFLTEAQIGGFSLDVIIQVAAKEFSDPRLKTHVLTVLKSMQSTRKKTSSFTSTSTSSRTDISFVPDSNTMVPLELFGLLAECENQKNPGEALLVKAKDLRWSLLAMIASCFSDVSPLSCLTVWLEITAARETSSIKVNDISSKIGNSVGAAVVATNTLLTGSRTLTVHYNRKNPKRRRLMEPVLGESTSDASFNVPSTSNSKGVSIAQEIASEEERNKMVIERSKVSSDYDEALASLSNMVAVLCEQHLFLPLLRAFEMFLPSCSLLPFIRSLQAFSQMRLSEASAHLASFSSRIKEEPFLMHTNAPRDGLIKTAWISSTAVKAADAMLSTCPSAYEKRCLLQLLAAADFGDGGAASAYFRRLYWKINLAEPSLRKNEDAYLGNETLDDASLLTALEKNGRWEHARNWARQLESSGSSWKAAVHHVTEAQAEAMVIEWKEYLWDVPEERAALWSHCQTLFLRYSFPALQAGLFFLKHAEAIEKEIPPRELHEILLLSLQWLSGTMTQTPPVYPLHLLREIETRVWLLAVESEAQFKGEGDFILPSSVHNLAVGNSASIIEQTANIITKMDSNINSMRMKAIERNGTRENNLSYNRHLQLVDPSSTVTAISGTRTKRRSKTYLQVRRPTDNVDVNNDSDDNLHSPRNMRSSGESSRNLQVQEENMKIEASVSGWEENVRPAEMERAILSLLEFGQITAAKQLQHKLSPEHVPPEIILVDTALKIAALSSSDSNREISESALDPEAFSVIQSLPIPSNKSVEPLQVLESLATKCGEGCGRGLCWRIIAVVKAAKVLGLLFSEAFEKQPIELLQLLSLKAQDSLEEAKLLVQTHAMPPPSIARILAESFLKGLLAAHRGGYMDSQREEGPAPLLWRFSDFLKWAELCPSEPEIGHALMRLVMTGQEIPHACEVELLILSHHLYKSSACLDGVDVLVTLAANRVESYVLEGDFACLARLVTGVSNFHALNFILNILIENGQLDLLLQKYSTTETATGTSEAVRGFRMAVLTSLKLFNPHDLDAFAMVYHHFDMKHETASLLESRSVQYIHQWFSRRDKEHQAEDLLEAMRHIIEAAEVHSSIDAGHKTYRACARASLLSLQIRIPDLNWLELNETNARRVFVEQSRFQEALIVAEAYNLNQPSEWAPVLWNQMLKPDLIEEFVAEFVAVLPLQPSMLIEVARFYRAEVAARGDQSHFSVWLSPGGLPAEWVKHLGRSFRSLLKRTRDLRVRVQLASIATGFGDVIDSCMKVLDRVPENAGPLILRKGHGGAYLPLM